MESPLGGILFLQPRAACRKVKFADRGNQHRRRRKGVGGRHHRKDRQLLIAQDETSDRKESQKRQAKSGQRDRRRGIAMPQGHEQPGATSQNDRQKRRQLATKRTAKADHDQHAGDDPKKETEDYITGRFG